MKESHCKRGRVYIVGAGPGDPGLATLRAIEALRIADTVVYDRLVSRELLRYVRPGTRLVYAGKMRGRHTLTQDEINRILVEEACQGRIVVRLKGGDPYVFGRGEEECMYVLSHDIECIVVPGVTSAIAGPAYAGIPVTSRLAASSMAIVTGTEAEDKKAPRIDYKNIAKAVDTLVILMGVHRLEDLIRELLEGGLDPDTPAAIVQDATLPTQKVVEAPLAKLAEEARKAGIRPPAVIVIGRVVELRKKLWKQA